MKKFVTLAATCAFAIALTPGLGTAQQDSSSTTAGATTTTTSSTHKTKESKSVRRARKSIPNQPTANAPGSEGTAHNIEDPRHNTNAEAAGTPAGTAEENMKTAKAHSNTDAK